MVKIYIPLLQSSLAKLILREKPKEKNIFIYELQGIKFHSKNKNKLISFRQSIRKSSPSHTHQKTPFCEEICKLILKIDKFMHHTTNQLALEDFLRFFAREPHAGCTNNNFY